MSLRRFVGFAAAFAFLSALWVSGAQAAKFAGAKLVLDAKVESPAVNDSVSVLRTPSAGDTVSFQLFVPMAAGQQTGGYNLAFDNTDSVFTKNFTVVSATDLAGSALSPNSDGTVESALLITKPTVPTNGLVATYELVAKQNIAAGTMVKFLNSSTIVDSDFNTDSLDVSQAVLTFQAGPTLSVDNASPVIPRNGTVTATVTASGFAAGDTLNWGVTTSGAATVQVLVAGNAMTGSSFQSTETSIQLKGSGLGAATATVTASAGTDTASAVTVAFSEQTPITLASFSGQQVDDHVVLNWSTVSQTNNAGWRVLRSTDGKSYQVVGNFVQGAGTSDALKSYNFVDSNLPSTGKVYYKLEQVDLSGAVTESNAVAVVLGAHLDSVPTEFATNVFPNPFNPSTTISYDLPSDAMVSIVIYDALGQEVRKLVNAQTPAGRYRIQWNAKDDHGRSVGSGVYIAKVEAGPFSSSQKMLLLK